LIFEQPRQTQQLCFDADAKIEEIVPVHRNDATTIVGRRMLLGDCNVATGAASS